MTYKFIRYLFAILFCSIAFIAQADIEKARDLMETNNFKEAPIDNAYSIDDTEALNILFSLLENEGLSLGTSSGINVAGAIKLAKDLGPGKTIVTVLCDKSDRYHSKLFNKNFLIEKVLPFHKWL